MSYSFSVYYPRIYWSYLQDHLGAIIPFRFDDTVIDVRIVCLKTSYGSGISVEFGVDDDKLSALFKNRLEESMNRQWNKMWMGDYVSK